MDDTILRFVHVLRRNGLGVSTAESIDAFTVTEALGLSERAALKAGLRAAVVKRSIDIPVFDSLFDTFFSGTHDVIAATSTATVDALELEPPDMEALMRQIRELIDGFTPPVSKLTQALLTLDEARLEALLRRAGDHSGVGNIARPFQIGQHSYAMGTAAGIDDVERDMEGIRAHLGMLSIDPRMRRHLERFLERRLHDLRDMLGKLVRLQLDQKDIRGRQTTRTDVLAEKSFYYLTEEEIRKMNDAVVKLARRIRNAVSIKRRRARRGRFDVKATLRKSLQTGGVPFRLRCDIRKKEKPRVVILCDVSDSVRNVSRFMLQLVYSLQDLYSKVRSFIFVGEIAEITKLFEDNAVHEALDLALHGDLINVYAHSDFGRAFLQFHRDHLNAVNNRTMVLILGDARNNYNLAHEWVLRDIKQRAKQVVWLNPENRLTWGFGDSEMNRYAPHCTIVEECRNLSQLYRVIDHLGFAQE